MKLSIFAGIAAASFAVTSVMAEDVISLTIPEVTAAQAPVIEQVTKDVKASPESAAEMVKKAIADSKADSLLVAQIMRAAMLASPDQFDSIYAMVVAVAPDATDTVNLMVAAMLDGDEVAPVTKGKIIALLNKYFHNTTDLSVDDYNKNNKELFRQKILNEWVKVIQGKQIEVKLNNFSYFVSFGADGHGDFNSVIIKRDTSTLPLPPP